MNTNNFTKIKTTLKDQLKEAFCDLSWHIPIKEESLIKTKNALLAAGFDNLELKDSD